MEQDASHDDRWQTGLHWYRLVYGDDAVEFQRGAVPFFDLMLEHLFAEVWSRPFLTVPERRLLSMGVLAARGELDLLGLQFRRALASGELSAESVREIAIHLVPYVGYPLGRIFQVAEDAIEAQRGDTAMTADATVQSREVRSPENLAAEARRRVGFLGLGRMGGPMAAHVARFHSVRGYDLDGGRQQAFVGAGVAPASSPAAAASGAEVICIVVFDEAQARAVLSPPDGILSVVEPGAVIAIHTTMSVRGIEELSALAESAGASLIDAGISGGVARAEAGTLVTMVGGQEESFNFARPVFDTFSSEVVHAGSVGRGMALKLIRNAVGYTFASAVSEAIDVAGSAGIDLGVLEHVLRATRTGEQGFYEFGSGGMHELRGGQPDRREGALHNVQLGEKDLQHMLELAQALRVPVPLTAEALGHFSRVLADLD